MLESPDEQALFKVRAHDVELFNKYPKRVLTGTDFVASIDEGPDAYAEEVATTRDILSSLNHEAFRRIALGQNYFDMLGLPFEAPPICQVD